MKFFYSPESLLTLTDYGIKIPLTDLRIHKILELLESKNIPVETDFSEIHLSRDLLENVHTKNYVSKIFGNDEQKKEIVIDTFELIDPDGNYHRYDPSSAKHPLSELVSKVLLQTKGTMATVKGAIDTGASFHLGGGYHHAMSFRGRGFCMLNDIVVSAKWAQKELGVKRVWVIDVDAHKGDGTAELTRQDPSIRTLSIHMKEGWPLDSGTSQDPWFIPSDIDIEVEAGSEAQYLERLENGLAALKKLDDKSPELAIVVQGSDPYELDGLPSSDLLKLTKGQMLERDLLVYHFLKARKIPQAYVMAGGYGDHAYEIYCQFLKEIVK